MSSLLTLRKSIRTALVSTGLWTEEAIIVGRQISIWNAIAFAMEATENGCVMVIGVAEGRKLSKEGGKSGIDNELTIPVTIFCPPELDEDDENATPEEDIWEKTVGFLDGWAGNDASGRRKHSMWELNYQRFSDDVELADDAPAYLARQTIFTIKHLIPRFTPPAP